MSMQEHRQTAEPMPFLLPEESAHRGLQYLRHAFISLAYWKKFIVQSEQKVISMVPEIQSVNIQHEINENNEKLPELRFSGKWLSEAGFHFGQDVSIVILKDLLVVCPTVILEEGKIADE